MLCDANIKLIQILCYLETQILIGFVLFVTDFSTFSSERRYRAKREYPVTTSREGATMT